MINLKSSYGMILHILQIDINRRKSSQVREPRAGNVMIDKSYVIIIAAAAMAHSAECTLCVGDSAKR